MEKLFKADVERITVTGAWKSPYPIAVVPTAEGSQFKSVEAPSLMVDPVPSDQYGFTVIEEYLVVGESDTNDILRYEGPEYIENDIYLEPNKKLYIGAPALIKEGVLITADPLQHFDSNQLKNLIDTLFAELYHTDGPILWRDTPDEGDLRRMARDLLTKLANRSTTQTGNSIASADAPSPNHDEKDASPNTTLSDTNLDMVQPSAEPVVTNLISDRPEDEADRYHHSQQTVCGTASRVPIAAAEENLRRLKQELKDLKIHDKHDVEKLSMEGYRKLVPKLIRTIYYLNHDPGCKGIYKNKPALWPSGVFWGDPNNRSCRFPDGRLGKPKEAHLKEMCLCLFDMRPL